MRVRVSPEGLQVLDQVAEKSRKAGADFQAFNQNVEAVTQKMGPAREGAKTLGKSLADLATNGELSGHQLLNAADALVKVSGPLNAIRASNPTSTFEGLVGALVKFSPLAIAGGLAVAGFHNVLMAWTETAKAATKRAKEWSDTVSAGVAKIRDEIANTSFEASIAGMNEFQQASARTAHEIQKTGEAAGVAKGEIKGLVDASQTADLDLQMKKLSAASQDAGRALSENIRKGTDDAMAELGKLERGNAGIIGDIVTEYGRLKDAALPIADALVKIEPADTTLQKIRDLGKALEFKGSLAEMQKLQRALDENEAKVREVASAAGFSEEFIRGEVKKTTELIKQRFKEDQKIAIHVDPAAAEAELNRFLKTIGAKPVELQAKFDLSQAKRELDVLRSKIIDTPEGEFKLKLQGEASALEAKIKDERAKASEPVVTPIDADTSAALAKIAELNAAAEAAIGNVAHGGGQIFGDAASSGDLQAILADARQSTKSAIASKDVEALRTIQSDLRDFVRTFQVSATGGSTIPNDIAAQINELNSALRVALASLGGNSSLGGKTMADAVRALEEQTNVIRQAARTQESAANRTAAAAERSAAASEGVSRTFGGGFFGAVVAQTTQTVIRQQTGNRNFVFGG